MKTTDQPEPLPTVTESAPRLYANFDGCPFCGHFDHVGFCAVEMCDCESAPRPVPAAREGTTEYVLRRSRERLVEWIDSLGVEYDREAMLDLVDTLEWAAEVVERSPRPVLAPAVRCDHRRNFTVYGCEAVCSDCGAELEFTVKPPAPPAEPVEAHVHKFQSTGSVHGLHETCKCGAFRYGEPVKGGCRDCGMAAAHDAHKACQLAHGGSIPCSPGCMRHPFVRPAEPVEEAQRCAICGTLDSDEGPRYERGDFNCGMCGARWPKDRPTEVHAVEVEDEGARPLSVDELWQSLLAICQAIPAEGVDGENTEDDWTRDVQAAKQALDVAIRKEATAAPSWWESHLEMVRRQRDDADHNVRALLSEAAHDAARAEAAEGARDEQARAIVSAIDFIARGKATTAWNILRAARALSGEAERTGQ